jgi:hypothetical protein
MASREAYAVPGFKRGTSDWRNPMMQEMHGPLDTPRDDETSMTPQGTPDPGASGMGGTPARQGNTRKEVAQKSGSPRAAGRGSKQPTKRTSGAAKAKRAAAKKAPAPAKKAAAKKSAGAGAARKAAATQNTAKKRASKTGASRKRVHMRH